MPKTLRGLHLRRQVLQSLVHQGFQPDTRLQPANAVPAAWLQTLAHCGLQPVKQFFLFTENYFAG
jgi:hypothetical protein